MAEDVAHTMDELGYDTLWMAEHHFQREGYEVIPNLILFGTYLATQTRRLKFGCAFNVTPMWHPIRLAEDYAMADYLTRGRVVMGVGRGYHTREVESLGGPLLDAEANAALFREQMEILFKAFNEEPGATQGRFYTIPADVDLPRLPTEDVTLVPRPVNRPVEMWQAIASGKSIPFMVQHGIKGMVTMNGELITRQIFGQFRDEAARSDATWRPARTWPGAPACTWPTASKKPSTACGRTTTSATSGSRRSASCATPTSRAARGARPARRPAYRPSKRASARRPGWSVRRRQVIDRLRELESEYPGPGAHRPPLARGHARRRMEGPAAHVRPRRDARLLSRGFAEKVGA